ncbi:MAG TPA: phosphotransferase, partial [Streptosporangiaceae bacterium]|nr:phosphotransferase [Streptosporangiaceae bacterium]
MASLQTTGTAIPAGDLRLVIAAFALGPVRQVRFLPEGLISRNWQITAGRGVFALKQIKDAPPPQARRNLRVAAALRAAGIPALEPVLTVTGDTIAEADERHYCLSWWI